MSALAFSGNGIQRPPFQICLTGSISREESFKPFRERLDDVVIDDEGGDQKQEGETRLHDPFFEAQAQVPANQALDQQH